MLKTSAKVLPPRLSPHTGSHKLSAPLLQIINTGKSASPRGSS